MICMPGLIETHWHHWTNICRTFVRNDDPRLGYFPGHGQGMARTISRWIPIAAQSSASPRRSAPASPRRTTGATTRAAPRTPTPRSAPCANSASAAGMPTARRRAGRTSSRWTWPTSPASSGTGCRATAWSRSASAPAMSAAIPIPRAALSRSRWRGESGVGRGSSACRSRCMRPDRRSRGSWTTPGCSVPMCSSCTRPAPRPRIARSWRPRVSAIRCRRSASLAGPAMPG